MLSITFGYSKYYVDSLSENVKRGNRTKLENGWRPNKAPLGYLNDRATKTIVPDPDRFAPVREMWELMLTGAYTVPKVFAIARFSWGLTTPPGKRSGGKPIALSAVNAMFTNPFYAGVLEWGDKRGTRTRPVLTIAICSVHQESPGGVDRKDPWGESC